MDPELKSALDRLATAPEDPQAHRSAALAWIRAGDPSAAAGHLTQAEQLGAPPDAAAWHAVAALWWEAGEAERALKAAERSLAIDPTDATVRDLAGRARAAAPPPRAAPLEVDVQGDRVTPPS